MRCTFFIVMLLMFAGSVYAQQDTTANAAEQDPASETGKFKKNCPFKHVVGCAEVLFTGQPVHIALGSIAPQNGFAAGVAYVGHKTTDNGRISWNSDAVASNNASWRAGLYVKFVDTHQAVPQAFFPDSTPPEEASVPVYTEQPVFNLYVQAISLNKIAFFGLGPGTSLAGRSYYGMTETILGGNTVRPLNDRLNMGFYAELNGRFVNIRPSPNQPSPSIELLYTPVTAPGLASQPAFLQFGVGMRMRPSAFNDRLHFNYDIGYRPFIAVSDSNFSFQRLTIDLNHARVGRGLHLPEVNYQRCGRHVRITRLYIVVYDAWQHSRALLFPAHAGRFRSEWQQCVEQLPGLSLSRAESFAVP